MVLFDVIISPKSLSLLDSYIDYILNTLMNPQAAMNLWHDAKTHEKNYPNVPGASATVNIPG
jgi:hypothetical protein